MAWHQPLHNSYELSTNMNVLTKAMQAITHLYNLFIPLHMDVGTGGPLHALHIQQVASGLIPLLSEDRYTLIEQSLIGK